MSVDIQLRTRQYIQEDSELHTCRRENLKSHGENVDSRKQVSEWCNQFKEGRTSLLDEERAGRPTNACNAVNERRVEQLLLTDSRMKLKETVTSYSSKTCWNAYSRCQTFAWQCNSPHCWKNT
jgi:hypothetical protein